MQTLRWILVASVCGLSALCGCAKGDDDDDSAATTVDAGEVVHCPAGTPSLTVGAMTGLQAMGKNKLIQAQVLTADHVPPERYANTWTVGFMDAQGAPLDDVKVEAACAYMPVHLHGSPPRKVTPLADPDQVELTELNLFMSGPWEIQLAVTSPSAANGTASEYTSCDIKRKSPGSELITLAVCQPND